MTVGIAFVPHEPAQQPARALTEGKRTELLNCVAEHFRKFGYVKAIEIIPSAYLTPKGGFANLDQIRTMYGIETIALVSSYDQVQFADEEMASVLYWTIVGAYVVPAEKNSTSTMVDAVRSAHSQSENVVPGATCKPDQGVVYTGQSRRRTKVRQ